MKEKITIPAKEALNRLTQGNTKYLTAKVNTGDISAEIRTKTYIDGQSPYAVIVTCSDSRVIPESIFSAGIGELFVIRVAGNVVGDIELGSIEYAVSHLHTQLVVVMGHTHCGAVSATLQGKADGHTKSITDEISVAIGNEKNAEKACKQNVSHTADKIINALSSKHDNLCVVKAIYQTDSGVINFF